jgi:hypothetical protein
MPHIFLIPLLLQIGRSLSFYKMLQLAAPSRMSQFPECLRFDLANPLTGNGKILPDFLQGMIGLFSYSKTHP